VRARVGGFSEAVCGGGGGGGGVEGISEDPRVAELSMMIGCCGCCED
jgi:hypothetical protein